MDMKIKKYSQARMAAKLIGFLSEGNQVEIEGKTYYLKGHQDMGRIGWVDVGDYSLVELIGLSSKLRGGEMIKVVAYTNGIISNKGVF